MKKVLLINGSPHKAGCTFTALEEIARQLEKDGVASEIVHIGDGPHYGCIGCGACRKTGHCWRAATHRSTGCTRQQSCL